MEVRISATEARKRFGELMHRVQLGPVVIERRGRPLVVMLSRQVYDALVAHASQCDWCDLLKDAHQCIRAELAGRDLPPAAEALQQIRDERNGDLTWMNSNEG